MVTRTDGPFEYWEVTGDAVRSAAEAPGTNAAVIESLAGELAGDEKRAADAIEGDIEAGVTANTTAAKDVATSLAAKGQYAVGLLKQFGTDVDTFDTTVNQINVDYHAQYTSTLSGMHHQPEYRDGTETINPGEVAAGVKGNLMPRYHKAEGVIDDAADTVASMFKQGPTDENVRDLVRAGLIPLASVGLYPSLVLTDDDKREALKAAIKGMTPKEQAQYVKDHKEIDAKTASVISPEAQTILANDVADDIKDHDVDGETVRLMNLLKDQTPFAHALYEDVSPDQIAQAIQVMSGRTFPPGGGNPPYDQADRAEIYKGFIDAAGVTFATYTKGTGEYLPDADLATTWADAITDEDKPQNASALTMLIKHGGQQTSFDPDFLADVTDKVYDWEKSHDGDSVWRPLDEKLGNGYGIYDPTIDRGDPDDPTDDSVGYKTSWDGLANLLGGMEKTPEAAHEFFDDGKTTDYDGQPINEKLHYLLSERVWPTDDGDGAGIALEGATLYDRTDSPDGKTSAELASQMVHLIAGESGRSNGVTALHDWHLPEGMTDNVGNITASYVNDLMDAATSEGDSNDTSGGDWTNGGGEDGPYGIRADKDTWGKLLFELGQNDDKDGLQTVVTAAVLNTNDETSRILHDYKDPDDLTIAALNRTDGDDPSILQRLGDHATTSGSGLNFIYENGMKGGHDGEEADQTRRELFSKAFGVATDFVPSPAGKVAGIITSTGLSEINDAIGKQPDSASDGWKPGSTEEMKSQLQYGTYNALLDNGYLDPAKDPNYGLDDKFTVTNGDHVTIDPDLHNSEHGDAATRPGVDMTPGELEDAFAEWLAGSDEKGTAGAPSAVFGQFLESYAGAAIK